MTLDTVNILDGNEFVVSDRHGDIASTPIDTHGLFLHDTRFLSRWYLTINKQRPSVLTVDEQSFSRVQFFMALATGTIYVDSHLSVVRRRSVGGGFREELVLVNHGHDAMDLEIRVEAAADFADLFEIKDQLATKQGTLYRRTTDHTLTLGYERGRFRRETQIKTSEPGELEDSGYVFHIRLGGHQSWSTTFEVIATAEVSVGQRTRSEDERWAHDAPTLVSSWAPLELTMRRSLVDLGALRFRSDIFPGAMPAAGLPWFMAIFGRDSILTSLQALPFSPELSAKTLRMLALFRGRVDDAFRDEEPGKILHELRLGELTAFEERPHSPYFGASDSTPLYLVLLDEYERWTGDRELARSLEHVAREAIEWMDRYGDRDGDGYIEYERRNTKTGLENQCWKDSWDAIVFADGTLAPTPLATCEIQGYAYDARVRLARLAREVYGDPAWADQLERSAAELKRRFNADFWIPEREFFALALDAQKRRVDSLTSNIGHLLWSGIVDTDKAAACARHLMSDALFSGWGVRTMATTERAYNPLGYHVGTVWPHDNSFIAWGLRRYGFRDEAARIAFAMLEAAERFHHRLPEVFAGYPRETTDYPVEFPTACSPQAWAAGAPLLFLRTLLGLEPSGEHLIVDPALPHQLERLELLDIPGRWGKFDAFGRARH
jgi:glycogen debranching enzyme